MHSVETMFTLRTFLYYVLENYLHDERKSNIPVDTKIIIYIQIDFLVQYYIELFHIHYSKLSKVVSQTNYSKIFTSHLGNDTCRCHLVDFVQRFVTPVQ